jgi:hypothetical protein
MKVYKLSWTWYEDDEYYLFSHPKSSQEQFKKDVKSLLRKYGNEYIDQEDGWVGAPQWVKYISKKLSILGYRPMTVLNWSFSGAYLIENRYHSKKIDKDVQRWQEVVGARLTKKAIEKNRKFRYKLRRGATAEKKKFDAQEKKK